MYFTTALREKPLFLHLSAVSLSLSVSNTCAVKRLAACFISSPQKDGMQPHPAFFTHCFIVCLNPTQSQKQGVCLRVRDRELEERAIRVGHVITTYHQTACPVATGIIVPSLAWSLASLISPGLRDTDSLY